MTAEARLAREDGTVMRNPQSRGLAATAAGPDLELYLRLAARTGLRPGQPC